jgi:hypothetical protein
MASSAVSCSKSNPPGSRFMGAQSLLGSLVVEDTATASKSLKSQTTRSPPPTEAETQ